MSGQLKPATHYWQIYFTAMGGSIGGGNGLDATN
jgi:hypothetical protein